MIQVDVVITVDDFHFLYCSTENLDRFNCLPILCETWGWCVIREYEAVEDKTTVVGIIAKVSSIGIIFLPFGIPGSQTLWLSASASK
jgi:hypothetical protein